MDPGIRNLYGPVQSFTASCRQRIDHKDHIRLCLLYDSLHNLCRLHPCLRHHSRDDCTYDPAFFFYAISSIFLFHMQLIYHIWSQRIRRHFTVTKPYCQYRASLFFRMLFFHFLIFHIFSQKSCQSFWYLSVISIVCRCHIRDFQCKICSHRFPHHLRPVLRFNPDGCNLNLPLFIVFFFQYNAGHFYMIQTVLFAPSQDPSGSYTFPPSFSPSFLKLILVFPIFSEICIDRI